MEVVFRSDHKESEVELCFDASNGEVWIKIIGGEEQVDFIVTYEQWELLDSFINDQKRKHEQNEKSKTTTS